MEGTVSTPDLPWAEAREDGSSVILEDRSASQLHSKGYYGVFGPRGSLTLNRTETLYLVEVGRLRVRSAPEGKELSFREMLHTAEEAESGFEIPYLVYRDLRQRGYVVKSGIPGIDYGVLPRGGTYPSTPSLYWVKAISERSPFRLPDLVALLDQAQGARRKVLLGVVDEESDLTYYLARFVQPKGRHMAASGEREIEGMLLADRVTVFDKGAVELLGTTEAYGSRIGERLELSLVEAAYLVGEGKLSLVDGRTLRPLSRKTFLTRASAIEKGLENLQHTYSDLRRNGLVPKTGFKYGAHFRAYEAEPSATHAKYLVHSVPPSFASSWPELSRAIRLAHGVKKSFLLSWRDEEDSQRYLNLQRIRP
ncbi:MAG: tRNA-intron lyase [Candidatus Thermoplasmatota archaeon]|jgi:tRNA-intron endonuclease|nr:tRNA-intron lyase [Candidatus Thermoplasmatota archaeon]